MGLLRIGNSLQMNEPSTKGRVLLLVNFKVPLHFLPQFPHLKDVVIHSPSFKNGDNASLLKGKL